ncbi:hypothetical protein GCM10009760_10450 [Kitasatospora kazusensis]|uniref:AMP-dependent synthetase/ligase domain-containing protein n=1 Tax=Kitasatospora kazusensis TaxID=407974 RepID=A0ABN2YXI0_9ACTN
MIKLDDIRRHAANRPEQIAVVDGASRLTWGQFADHVDRMAAGLSAQLPPTRPARAVHLADNRWELAVAMAACATLGVSCTGLDVEAGAEELTGLLARIQPTVVFVSTEHRQVLDGCVWPTGPEALHVLLDGAEAGATARPAGVGSRSVSFGALLATEPLPNLPIPLPYESLTVVPGEGGSPRVAVRRSAVEGRHLVDLVDEFGFDGSDVHLTAAPLAQPTARGLARTFLSLGGTLVLGPHRDPAALAALIVEERVTTAVIDPVALVRLLSHPGSEALAGSAQLRCVIALGRHLNRWVVNTAWEQLGPVLHLAYATPETGLNAIMGPDELHVAPIRSGRMMLGSSLAILDQDGAPLPAGATGRVAISGYQVMDGYLEGEAEFTTLDLGQGPQRFFVTGERGQLDEQGRLVVTSRGTEVPTVSRNGAVDTEIFRLEADLLNLPCLRDTAVMRVDVPGLGDSLVVPFIAVAVGRELTGYKTLTAACNRRIPSLPAHVIAVDHIPYSPTGTINTDELLDSVLPIIKLNLQLEHTMQQEMSA